LKAHQLMVEGIRGKVRKQRAHLVVEQMRGSAIG
jgi:hypothetical protein